jgi:hypothetical protein
MDNAHTTLESSAISARNLCDLLNGPLLEDYCAFHSEFQVHFLILKRNGGTLWGCYQQALREIVTRWTSLPTQLEPPSIVDDDSRTELGKITRRVRNQVNDEYLKELACFIAYAIVIKDAIGEVSVAKRAEFEFELWTYRSRLAVCRDLLASGSLTPDTVELLHVLPQEIKQELVASLSCVNARERLFQWCFSYNIELPSPSIKLIDSLFASLQRHQFLIEAPTPA